MNAHAISIKKVLKELNTSEKGLSKKEANSRLIKYGLNEIQQIGGTTWYKILFLQFTNIMVIILMLAAVVSYVIGEHIDAYAIGVIIIINAVIGFSQEFRAEKAVEALKKMAAPNAIVIRNKEVLKIDAKKLVPGDIILLEEGSHIPADARLIQATQLQTIEASLTGESLAAHKTIDPIKKFDSIGDLHNIVFLGTMVSQGHGLAVVTKTGMSTEFGKIANMVQQETDAKTPLQKQLDKLTKTLAITVLGIAGILFAFSFVTGRDPVEMFILSVSLAVSVIPEGLPAVITLTLAIGVQKIAKKNAIIRKLPAAETLGSTSVICTDKTGTLTQNQMTVQVIWANNKLFNVSGTGYQPKGTFSFKGKKLYPLNVPELEMIIRTAALCNNAKLLKNKKHWDITGDPTEACLLTMAQKAGMDLHKLEHSFPRKDELIFDSERKRMSTLNQGSLYSKGATDNILSICTHIKINGRITKLSTGKKKEILKENEKLAKSAYRILSFAYKEHKGKIKEEKMVFLGMVGMIDPPRSSVIKAIQTCKSAHIKVIMITGDHALTAKAIGSEIGLFDKGDKIITGAELEKMSLTNLKKIVEKVRIFARVNPAHKVKILKALKAKGHIVAMTGDGVNDAPALQSADIGVAMGVTGTDVAKEAAEMILTDDNFATIVQTIESGRTIYRNIKKFIRFMLSANFDEILLISIIFVLGDPIPFLPLQILWVNLLTDALPAIALGTDVPDKDIMKLKPRNPKANIWNELISFSLIAGILSTIVSLIIYYTNLGTHSIEHTRTMMFTTIVVFEMMLVFSVRFGYAHYFTHFFKNKLLLFGVALSILFQLMAIYLAPFQKVLQTEALTSQDWTLILSISVGAILIIEIWKHFRKRPNHV